MSVAERMLLFLLFRISCRRKETKHNGSRGFQDSSGRCCLLDHIDIYGFCQQVSRRWAAHRWHISVCLVVPVHYDCTVGGFVQSRSRLAEWKLKLADATSAAVYSVFHASACNVRIFCRDAVLQQHVLEAGRSFFLSGKSDWICFCGCSLLTGVMI